MLPVPVVPEAGLAFFVSVSLIFIILVDVKWYYIACFTFIYFVMKHTFKNISYVGVCIVFERAFCLFVNSFFLISCKILLNILSLLFIIYVQNYPVPNSGFPFYCLHFFNKYFFFLQVSGFFKNIQVKQSFLINVLNILLFPSKHIVVS